MLRRFLVEAVELVGVLVAVTQLVAPAAPAHPDLQALREPLVQGLLREVAVIREVQEMREVQVTPERLAMPGLVQQMVTPVTPAMPVLLVVRVLEGVLV